MKFATKITEPTDATYRELLDLQYRGESRGRGKRVSHTMHVSNHFYIKILKRRKRRKEGEVGRYIEKRDEVKRGNFCNTIGKKFKFIICTSCADGFLVEGLFPFFTPPPSILVWPKE